MDDTITNLGWIPTATTNERMINWGWRPGSEIYTAQSNELRADYGWNLNPEICLKQSKCIICDADSGNIICSRCAALLKQIVKDKLVSEIVGD